VLGAVLLVLLVLLSAACAGGGGTAADAASGTTVLTAAPVDFSARGPYRVGTMMLDVRGTTALLHYPADPASAARARHLTSYSMGDAYPPEVRAYLAPLVPALVQDIPVDVYQSPQISAEGPFPIVLHSHGLGGTPQDSSQVAAHLASWGFVVASPDHRSRDAAAVATESVVTEGEPDVRDLRATLDALARENTRPGSPLLTGLDTTAVAAEGLDVGALAAYRFAAGEPKVKVWAGHAPVELRPSGSTAPPVLGKPALVIAGERDSLVPLADVQAQYDWLGAPKRLAVVHNAGHAAFVDACAPSWRRGGLGTYAEAYPALVPMLQRNDDGCAADNIDPARATAYIEHLSVAQYRLALGLDTSDVSLRNDFVQRTFPEAALPIQSVGAS
jgi:predicted dienelactone hydrolase